MSKIETRANRKFNGKVDRDFPVAAIVDGEVIAVGENATDAKERAVAEMMEVYCVAHKCVAVGVTQDGTVIVVREYRLNDCEISYCHKKSRYRPSGITTGYRLNATCYTAKGETIFRTPSDVLEYVLAQYDDCTAAA